MHELDNQPGGFDWIDCTDAANSVISFVPPGEDGEDVILCVFNFTPVPRPGYRVGVPGAGFWTEVLNTDAGVYGGSNVGNSGGVYAEFVPMHGQQYSVLAEPAAARRRVLQGSLVVCARSGVLKYIILVTGESIVSTLVRDWRPAVGVLIGSWKWCRVLQNCGHAPLRCGDGVVPRLMVGALYLGKSKADSLLGTIGGDRCSDATIRDWASRRSRLAARNEGDHDRVGSRSHGSSALRTMGRPTRATRSLA